MKIEKNIPYPKSMYGHPNQKYPWVNMDVGDSVKTEETDINSKAIVTCRAHGCKTGKKFRTAREDDGTIRVWRVS